MSQYLLKKKLQRKEREFVNSKTIDNIKKI